MKKLSLALLFAIVLVPASITQADDCGHQHAERCLISTTTVETKQPLPEAKITQLRELLLSLKLYLPWI